MAANFLDLLVRPEAEPTTDLAEFVVNGLISELPALRRIAVSTMTRILFHIKQRSFRSEGDIDLITMSKVTNPLKKTIDISKPLPGDYTDKYLNSSLTPLNESNAGNTYV